MIPWLRNLLLAGFPPSSFLLTFFLLSFFSSLSHSAILSFFHPPSFHLNLLLLTPLTGHIKTFCVSIRVLTWEQKATWKMCYPHPPHNPPPPSCSYLLITKETVGEREGEKERKKQKKRGGKVREGLNPGIKISELFFHSLPLPHSNCS